VSTSQTAIAESPAAHPGKSQFKRWLFAPPRPHGAVIKDRTVSNLELFYDLVYVAVISQASRALALDVSPTGFAHFAIVFAMIWFAWFNGSLYIELHGREDGRTRLSVFLQMGILALLAVFTGEAAGATGVQFAIVYAIFLAFMGWQWYIVRELDRIERPEFMRITFRYVTGMAVSTLAIGATAFLDDTTRVQAWMIFASAWIVGLSFGARARGSVTEGILPTDSLVERFGLFTIIVLGEVILAVVTGLSTAGADALTIVTGSLAMIIGFGQWWIYFDVVGRRLPRPAGPLWFWMLSHLPIQLSIVAAGAGIVNLIEHAHDPSTPPATAILLGGSVALGLLGLIVTERCLEDAIRLADVYRPMAPALATGAAVALLAGLATPAPWLLAALLVAVLTLLWFFVVARMIRAGVWGSAISPGTVQGLGENEEAPA
jgi:low temperature requirement protein LtrA